MVPMSSEESAGPAVGGDDPLRRAVHVALALYLLPVLAIVCVIGGAAIAIDRAGRLASRVASRGRPTPEPISIAPPEEPGGLPTGSRGRRGARARH